MYVLSCLATHMGGLFGKEERDVLTGDQAKGEEVVEGEGEEAASEEAEVEEGEVGQAGSKLRYVLYKLSHDIHTFTT